MRLCGDNGKENGNYSSIIGYILGLSIGTKGNMIPVQSLYTIFSKATGKVGVLWFKIRVKGSGFGMWGLGFGAESG